MAKRVLQPLVQVARDLHATPAPGGEVRVPRLAERRRHSGAIREHAARLCAAIDHGDVERTLGELCNLLYDCYAAAVSWGADLTPYWDEVRRARSAQSQPDIAGILDGAQARACPLCGVSTQLRRGGKLLAHADPSRPGEIACLATGLTLAQAQRLARIRAAHEGPEPHRARECKGGCGRLVPANVGGGLCDECRQRRRQRRGQFSSEEVAARNRGRGREHRETVERLWREGRTLREIGAQLGWSESTIRRGAGALRALGYDLPHRTGHGRPRQA